MGYGGTVLAVGLDNNIYAQELATMSPESPWHFISKGAHTYTHPIEAIAVSGAVIYGVGTDKDVYSQSLRSLSADSPWTLFARGPVDGLAMKGDIMYAVGLEGL